MFSLYGLTGPSFRGTLEEMRSAAPRPVRALRGAQAVQPVAEPADSDRPPGPESGAVAAYRAMLRKDLDRGPLYHAAQIMTREVVTVNAGEDVAAAWKTLLGHRIHQAPVLDRGRLVGIVSERHLLTALNVDDGHVRDVLARRVSDVMASPVVAAEPVTDIRRIATVMLEYGVDGVPVMDPGQGLVGFVSRSDILRAVITDPPLSLWG